MDNLGFGLQITVLGMGLVFGILVLLWGLLGLALRLDPIPAAASTCGEEELPVIAEDGYEQPGGASVTGLVPVTSAGLDPRLVAAIAIAVAVHTEDRRRQAAPAMRAFWPGSHIYASRWVSSGRARQNHGWIRAHR